MKQSERTLAFFAALLLTFGITGFDFENPSFEANSKEYLLIGSGLLFAIIFVFRRIRS